MEGCMSVYFILARDYVTPRSPLREQVKSRLNIVEIKRSIFRKDVQLMQWINRTCSKTVKTHLKIALANFCGHPLDRNVNVILK